MTTEEQRTASPTDLPERLDLILVPIVQPRYGRELIELALSIAGSETSRILALLVSLGNIEEDAKDFHQLEPIVQAYQEEGRQIELLSQSAGSISRGILDAAREHGVDLIVFGGREIQAQGPDLDTVAKNVLPTAPCHVVLYRLGQSAESGRLVVHVDEEQSRSAAQLAIRLGQRLDRPVEAMYIRTDRTSAWDARGKIESLLVDLPGEEGVKRTIVESQDAVSGLLSRINNDDTLVMGLAEVSEWERLLRTDMSRVVMRKWRGALLLISSTASPVTRRGRFRRWLTPTLTQVEQEEIERDASASGVASLDYVVLILISAILATFGLMLNSSAVIIGAMLVAPLMSPLIAFATGMTLGRLGLVWRATGTLIIGIAAALSISILIGWLSPTSIVTSEMAGRGNPSFLDMGVALASGFIGAYATARKHIPAALAGVAIAAALMPPLTTVGLGLAYGDLSLASGAALLFVTNIISIILAAWGTFFWLGMRPSGKVDVGKTRRTSAILVLIFVLVLGALLAQNASTIFSATIEQTLRESFGQAELISYEIRQGDPLQVVATVRMPANETSDTSEIIAAQNNLEAALNEPVDLAVIVQPIIEASVAKTDAEVEALIGDVLDEELSDMNVLGFVFEVGNPTLVVAAVDTELERGSAAYNDQANSAEQALTEGVGLPVVLNLFIIESFETAGSVDATDQALTETIDEVLTDSLTCCEVLSTSFQVGNPFLVTASVATEMDPADEAFLAQVQAAENNLSAALGWPVNLTVVISQPTPTPTEMTPMAAPTLEPTEVIPTLEPTEEPVTPEPPTVEPATPTPTPEPPTPEPTVEPATPTPTEEPPTPEPTVETATPTTAPALSPTP